MAGGKRVVESDGCFASKMKQKSPEVVVAVVHVASEYQMMLTAAAAAHTSGALAFDGEQIRPAVP